MPFAMYAILDVILSEVINHHGPRRLPMMRTRDVKLSVLDSRICGLVAEASFLIMWCAGR